VERKLAAVLAADVVGYTRLMEIDEANTLERLSALREQVLRPLITEYRGRIVKLIGDGLLVEFSSIVDAVSCAVAWQERVAEQNLEGDEDKRLRFRIGINLGDVVVEDGDIHGGGVNIAARLEALAEPGSIYLSGDAYRQAKGKIRAEFEDLGERELKNLSEPVRVYRVAAARCSVTSPATTAEPFRLPDKPSIAVLPFINMSGDTEQEHFSDGISEDIITALSKVRKLFIVARSSTFTYKGQAIDVKRVGREQGVRYVLEGSVRKGGNRLRITAQLIDAVTGHHIWAQRYDREVEDIFVLQDEITLAVASALQVELTEGDQARLWASGTQNLAAWMLTAQAAELLDRHRRGDTYEGQRLLEEALKLDENYATAWTMLGWMHWEGAFDGWSESPDESLELALEAAERSHFIDPTSPEPYALRSVVRLSRREFELALDQSAQAIAVGPNHSFVHAIAALVSLLCDKPQRAIELIRMAMRLCPIYPAWYLSVLGRANWFSGRKDEAIANSQAAVRSNPDLIFPHLLLAIAYIDKGRAKEAGSEVGEVLRIDPSYTTSVFSTTQPIRNTDVLAQQVAALQKAGLPE